jgi:hypothetical protein
MWEFELDRIGERMWGWEGERGMSKRLACHFIKFERGRRGRVDGVSSRDRMRVLAGWLD